MAQPLTIDLVRQTLRRLLSATAECVATEASITRTRDERLAAAEKGWDRLRADLSRAKAAQVDSLTAAHAGQRSAAVAKFEAEAGQLDREFASVTAEITQLCERDEQVAEKEYQESAWTLEAVYDAEKKKARERNVVRQRLFTEYRDSVQTVRADVAALLEEWRQIPKAAPGSVAVDPGTRDPAELAAGRIAAARERFEQLKSLIAPRLLIGDRMLYIGIAAFIVTGLIAGIVIWSRGELSFPATFAAAFAIASLVGGGGTALARLALSRHARRRVREVCAPLHFALAEAASLCRIGEEQDERVCRDTIAAEKQKFQREKQVIDRKRRELIAAALGRRDEAMKNAVARRDRDRADLEARRRAELERIDADHTARLAAVTQAADRDWAAAEKEYMTRRDRVLAEHDGSFTFLQRDWSKQRTEIIDAIESIERQNGELFPDWATEAWSSWSPRTVVPPTIRFGQMEVAVPEGPRDPALPPPPQSVTLPALLPFPHRCATLLTAAGEGRPAAAQALLALAARFLTSLPAGKVRLTIIDPVGLGENFAGLMHLADHDPQLVGARIWTEPAQIDKRLADLTAHMENVIQKYLRSQYASIEEYNAQAGEVAEPYRVLIVANFPANFSAEAARRLERIAASGASCGVYTIVSYDPDLPPPQDYQPADLERASLNLVWDRGRFRWKDSDFEQWPLTLDPPPANDVLLKMLDRVGSEAKRSGKVEVDFGFIAPPPEAYWRADSRGGINVPLGRAGATKRQLLQLGVGTAQHALVAGKTGSGKSTLLHALITNLALTYSPDEIELYLIDFKKGVEFKTYATHRLPHARVIAVESEREFGLSVLQRLDAELKRRGELFRTAGVQDIRGYRDSPAATAPLPRIMLIVDEFQEYFVEDDRVAQDAALLLDRLVRQGRAFGLHVLLGSQTLGGAYSLARSTIDQIAVRIALQCSEADAGLILSKDNTAARLLSRPGEAIYNDANGLPEGNDIFQVCWLGDDRRDEYLGQVAELARQRGYRPPAPAVVFEGAMPSDLTAHEPLTRLIAEWPPAGPPRDLSCWFGEAMAIKPPTCAVFRRQSANNLLILGQQPDPARALAAASALAAIAQLPRPRTPDDFPRVLILDGTPADDPLTGWFAASLGSLPGLRVAGPRDVADVMREVSGELERRQSESGAWPTLLILFGLQRFKELRKSDDDFGFNRSGGEATPAQRFATLLREGPTAGLHAMIWCDTLTNLQRSFERSTLREFEMKVLFQMGTNDSSSLIDSPAAARLGVNRALFVHEELTAPEKFRPFSLPGDAWLRSVGEKLR